MKCKIRLNSQLRLAKKGLKRAFHHVKHPRLMLEHLNQLSLASYKSSKRGLPVAFYIIFPFLFHVAELFLENKG